MTPVRFDLPPEARTFPLFAALPAEIRYQIWEHAIREPSMHFLKLVVDSDSSDMSNADSDASHDAQETQAQHQAPHPTVTVASPVSPSPANPRAIKTRQARLAPLYPHPRADSSRYVDTNRRLSILSASCAEAAQVVRRLLHQPTTLKLADDRAVSLGRHSPDIICLDYMSDDDSRFFNGCRIRYDVQCPGLDRIRHVAVRYCHQWEARSNPCPRCRRRHDPYSQRTYPVHVFQFLARQLPNLQTFYFIDYLILPKKPAVSQSDGSQQLMRQMSGFRSEDRTFFEVSSPDNDDWAVSSRVFQTLYWVRDHFRRYAVHSTTTPSRHPNPHTVQFKVLACQWDVAGPPTSPSPPLSCLAPKTSSNKRGFASACGENSINGRALKTVKSARRQTVAATPVPPESPTTAPLDTASGVFVFGKGNHFDFVFGRELLIRN